MEYLWQIFGYIVFGFGILDAIKYKFLTSKICKLKSSREISKKFLNISIGNRICLFVWGFCFLKDWVIWLSSLVALYFQFEALYYTYLHYPFAKRGLKNFKKPSFTFFIWNSIVPNRWAKRL